MPASKIAVIVPTIRSKHFEHFVEAWFEQFCEHDVWLVKVQDGDDPTATVANVAGHASYLGVLGTLSASGAPLRRSDLSLSEQELFSDHNPACRNLGFLHALRRVQPDVFISLDDDCLPLPRKHEHDAILAHREALERKWPLSWFSLTDNFNYMRGFPYGIRAEASAIVSHGLWSKNPDYDAPTDLLRSARAAVDPRFGVHPDPSWYAGPIPRGVFAPICGMHLAFTREALPYVYHCPVDSFPGCERFDDIWMGIELKKAVDKMQNKCIVSGYAYVEHTRASDPFKNLEKEALGIRINETLWKGEVEEQHQPFMDLWREKRDRYAELVAK